MKRIFISLPYSSSDPKIVSQRVSVAKEYFNSIMHGGDCPVCPVVVGHQLVEEFGIMGDYKTWGKYCEKELISCDEMHVLQIEGYIESLGVAAEVDVAKFHNIPIVFTCTYRIFSKGDTE